MTSEELFRTLLDLLQNNFAHVANYDEILSRKLASQDSSDKEFTHCIIAGGSNMKKLCPHPVLRFRIQDPGSGAFLTPGSGIRNRFFPDPGSRIPNPYF